MEITNQEMMDCLVKVEFKNDPYPYEGIMSYESPNGKIGCDVIAKRIIQNNELEFEIDTILFWDSEGFQLLRMSDEQLDIAWNYIENKFRS